jgi:hypothetical protein
VANIFELLNTQTALAEWDDARIDLASKLGTLGREDLP